MASLTSEQARALAKKRIRKGPHKARAEILEMQSLLLRDIRSEKTEPHIRAQCARAYDVLEERLRILSGKSLPPILKDRLPKPKKERKGPAVLPMPEVPSAASSGVA